MEMQKVCARLMESLVSSFNTPESNKSILKDRLLEFADELDTFDPASRNFTDKAKLEEEIRARKVAIFDHRFAKYKNNISCYFCDKVFDLDETTVEHICRSYHEQRPNFRGTCLKCLREGR